MPVRRQEHAPLKDFKACPDSKGTGNALEGKSAVFAHPSLATRAALPQLPDRGLVDTNGAPSMIGTNRLIAIIVSITNFAY
jgi:hypothetical protein